MTTPLPTPGRVTYRAACEHGHPDALWETHQDWTSGQPVSVAQVITCGACVVAARQATEYEHAAATPPARRRLWRWGR